MMLRTVTNDMLPALVELYQRDEVREALAWGPQLPGAEDVTAILYKSKPGTYTEAWAIADGEQIVGTISLANISPQHRSAEITNRAMYPHTGWLLGYRAVLEVLRYAFTEANLNRVECWVYDDNRATHTLCRRLVKKHGVKHEATLRQAIFKHNQYHDLYCYAVTKDQYVSSKGG